MKKFAFFPSNGIHINILFSDILYVESLHDYSIIHLLSKKITIKTHIGLGRIAEILPVEDFARVHRSYIINLSKLTSIEYGVCKLDGSELSISIGDAYKNNFYERINYIETTSELKKERKFSLNQD